MLKTITIGILALAGLSGCQGPSRISNPLPDYFTSDMYKYQPTYDNGVKKDWETQSRIW